MSVYTGGLQRPIVPTDKNGKEVPVRVFDAFKTPQQMPWLWGVFCQQFSWFDKAPARIKNTPQPLYDGTWRHDNESWVCVCVYVRVCCTCAYVLCSMDRERVEGKKREKSEAHTHTHTRVHREWEKHTHTHTRNSRIRVMPFPHIYTRYTGDFAENGWLVASTCSLRSVRFKYKISFYRNYIFFLRDPFLFKERAY